MPGHGGGVGVQVLFQLQDGRIEALGAAVVDGQTVLAVEGSVLEEHGHVEGALCPVRDKFYYSRNLKHNAHYAWPDKRPIAWKYDKGGLLQHFRPAAALHFGRRSHGCQTDRLHGCLENWAQLFCMLWIPGEDGFDICTFFNLLQAKF